MNGNKEGGFSLKNNKSTRQNSKNENKTNKNSFLTLYSRKQKYLNDYNCLSKKPIRKTEERGFKRNNISKRYRIAIGCSTPCFPFPPLFSFPCSPITAEPLWSHLVSLARPHTPEVQLTLPGCGQLDPWSTRGHQQRPERAEWWWFPQRGDI